jgi:sortase A
MRRVKSPEDLTIDELRFLLVEKRRKLREQRLERFRRSGRVVTLASEIPTPSLEHLYTHSEQQEIEFSSRHPSLRRRVLDGLLLLVEVAAVVGLVLILFNGLEIMRNLNLEFAQALEQPTLTPTPLISAVVLPSGHTPPNAPGGAMPNEAEIPEHLRPLVQSLINIPIPTPGPEQAIRIQIPAIGVDHPIVQGDGWEQLKKGVGQHIGSANPGQSSNMVLTAHNDIFGEIFKDLDRLKPGDSVIVHTAQRAYTYIVTDSEIVEPTRVEVMAPTNKPIVTLISCYPYLIDTERIIVRAHLQQGRD